VDSRSLELFSHVPIHLMPAAANDTLHVIPGLIKLKMYCDNDRL